MIPISIRAPCSQVQLADLLPVFCEELCKQEVDSTNRFIDIPDGVLDFYKMFRPSPLIRAYNLEKTLGTPARIYYKFEGNNTSGSHKLNSAAAQTYYAKQQGITSLTHRNRSRAVGHGPVDGLRLLRHRSDGLHGQDLFPAETVPQGGHRDLRRQDHRQPPATRPMSAR